MDGGDLRMMRVDYEAYARNKINKKVRKNKITVPMTLKFENRERKKTIR